ncbi:MAG: DNA recombination protein RmuC [Lachnospiraceae bacterium]|nr:DNA recombination protein RmuC [Lachnospiraceae bacterium]
MEYVILGVLALTVILLVIVLIKISSNNNIKSELSNLISEQNRINNRQLNDRFNQLFDKLIDFEREIRMLEENNRREYRQISEKFMDDIADYQKESQKQIEEINMIVTEKMQTILDRKINEAFETVVKNMNALGNSLTESQEKQRKEITENLDRIKDEFSSIREENQNSLAKLGEENRKSLDKINDTVNEKLQKTLNDRISQSFEAVNKRLAEVYAGLGEMKSVASGVSNLKNVLSNVKNRGILGEIRLSSILGDILAPNQYEEQFRISPDSRELVDFAVKLPGQNDNDAVYLPIDSKFPGDKWAALADAYDTGNADEIKQKRDMLSQEIRKCAKSIHDKYIVPPYSTDFAIMFLPFEGLYAEVVNMRLVEQLQREFHVNITGPSTMAAMLNSLQMGFRTLAIQKKSGEVWKILEAAKAEFNNFGAVLDSARNRLRQADEDLEKLIGRRTRAINRKLRSITNIEQTEESKELLEMISDDE